MKVIKNAEKATIELVSRLEILNLELKENGFNTIEHIKFRVKSEESIRQKLIDKNLDYSEQNIKEYIKDISGVRVIVPFIDDVYRIFSFIKSQKDLEIVRVKDYIKAPKKSGYKSLHMNILIPIQVGDVVYQVETELQIRTVAMDFFASVEHLLKYKNEKDIDDSVNKRLIACSQIISDLDKEMYEINRLLK